MVAKKSLQSKKLGMLSKPKPQEGLEAAPISSVPTFPIIGMGASAGGLEAFTRFFEAMPPDSGMAFVLVQHLDPTQPSLMAELLQRHTAMPVVQVTDRRLIEPNTVYIIPPNVDMGLLHSTLHLMEPTAARGKRLPIDFLFKSLAEDQNERAVGIILSGTGTDGTLGLKAIKGEGGMMMAQEPSTAQYGGMPQSAIATGLIDYVLPVEEMPAQLHEYIQHLFQQGIGISDKLDFKTSEDVAQKIFILLRTHTGHDFSSYKEKTFNRRVERRMAVHQIQGAADYLRYLQANPQELDKLFQELLIGVTSFFRNPQEFEALERLVIPRLFENRGVDQPVRIWVPGCSTGEEAYSIAMLIREEMDRLNQQFEVQIFATDIDERAIEKARLGIYPHNIAADISEQRLHRFFIEERGNYQIIKPIRDMVIFATHSLLKDPPFSRLDMVSFRNVMIYFNASLQRQVLPALHYALKPGGILFLGTSESLGGFSSLFRSLNRRHKLFERLDTEANRHSGLSLPIAPWSGSNTIAQRKPQQKTMNLRKIADEMLLTYATPPAVIVDQRGDILYFHHHTGNFLDPMRGEASLNVLHLAREGLKLPLIAALRKAVTQQEEIVYHNVKLQTENGTQSLTLRIKPVEGSDTPSGLLLVLFEPEAHLPKVPLSETQGGVHADGQQRIFELEQELQNTQQYLQTTIEELGTSNEELRSTVEELQSSNEELQSTLEEMQTAKEELQSVNEELVTVNAELYSNVEDLARANADFTNLLSNIDVAIIFLDLHQRIKRFNPAATRFVNLIDSDIGRPINHLVTNLADTDLLDDIQAVLSTLIPREAKVYLHDGSSYQMRVRPYRTANNAVDGILLIFTEIMTE